MRESQPRTTDSGNGRPSSNGNGGAPGDVRPEDRSHLLRRAPRQNFWASDSEPDGIRIRRLRRVNASFAGIPSLARNGDR